MFYFRVLHGKRGIEEAAKLNGSTLEDQLKAFEITLNEAIKHWWVLDNVEILPIFTKEMTIPVLMTFHNDKLLQTNIIDIKDQQAKVLLDTTNPDIAYMLQKEFERLILGLSEESFDRLMEGLENDEDLIKLGFV